MTFFCIMTLKYTVSGIGKSVFMFSHGLCVYATCDYLNINSDRVIFVCLG
jgi:hypothetical protein